MISDTSESFYLYMKHSENAKLAKRDNSLAWTFAFTQSEKQRIQDYISLGKQTYIILLCSEGDYNNTQIVVLTQKEYLTLIHKSSITIRWEIAEKQRKQKFSIPNRGGVSFEIECDRIKRKVTDIKDAI